jgi:hypothetical protein
MAPTHDFVPGRDVLQLQRQQHLQRRLVRHPHAQAGQGETDDPAIPHELRRFSQRERFRGRLAYRLIPHGTSAVMSPPQARPEPRRASGTLAGS